MKTYPHPTFYPQWYSVALASALVLALCLSTPNVYSQTDTTTVATQHLSLDATLQALETKFDCHFLYEPAVLRGHSVAADWLPAQTRVHSAIQALASQTKLEFSEIEPNYWVIKPDLPYGKLSGYISNSSGEPLVGATIYHTASQRGTASDLTGHFELWLPAGKINVQVSYVGYQTQLTNCWIPYGGKLTTNYQLQSSLDLGEVVVIGAPTTSLAFLAPSAPTETVAEDALSGIPVSELGQLLQFAAPSFHTTYQTNSDGTDHIDPATLRGLGPDQLLVLVNGKRRHSSALVNVNSTVGRGSVATDLNAIPLSAIERVEILPDGATAQYGADAIAGVINLVLKDSLATSHLQLFTGVTATGGGLRYGLGGHQQLWQKPQSFGNFSWRIDARAAVNRSGNYTGTIFGDDRDNDPTARAKFFAQTGFQDQQVMLVGSAAIRNAGLHWNMAGQLAGTNEWYAFGGFNLREGRAGGFYRFPFQQQKQSGLYQYGFSPIIRPKIVDGSQVVGLRRKSKNWQFDLSSNWGTNAVAFYIENSNNASLGLQSPSNAAAGKLHYGQHLLQFDAVRPAVNNSYSWRMGGSWRNEYFRQLAGDEWSWQNYGDTTAYGLPREAGIQVFPGFRPSSTVRMNRSSLAAYLGLERCWQKKFFPTIALRWEHWPGDGHHLLGKLALNYRPNNNWQIRAAFNTGLRPPSLPQLYFSSQSLQFVPQGEKLVGQEVAQLQSNHPFRKQLLSEQLQAEQSQNLSWGVDWQFRPNVLFQLNVYQVAIRERIILSSRLNRGSNTLLDQLLDRHELGSVQFFLNALRTQTRGLDLSLQQNWSWSKFHLKARLAGSFNRTKVQSVDLPNTITGLHATVFNREESARLESSQPASKFIANLNLSRASWSISWQATRFGSVQYLHPSDGQSDNWVRNTFNDNFESRDQRFSAKWLQDLSLRWQTANNWTIGLHCRNLFNVYPDEHTHSANTNEGIFRYSRYVQQFGVWGAQFMLDTQFNF